MAVKSVNNIIHYSFVIAKDGTGDFSTLRAGIAEAILHENASVYVRRGTYNLLEEFASEIAAAVTTQYGICMENGVSIFFEPGAKVTALYAGNAENVTHFFAPFYTGTNGGGFTLENLNIEASNTRYCVHDELSGLDVKTNNKYINCTMIFDNTTAPTNYYPQCIGGGCARASYVEIRNCYFKTKKAESQSIEAVSYHNHRYSSGVSKIIVSNSYFDDKATYRCSYYGTSVEISESFLNNNSFGSMPIIEHEAGSTGPENFIIKSFLNEIRS